jgi:uncharacterized protein
MQNQTVYSTLLEQDIMVRATKKPKGEPKPRAEILRKGSRHGGLLVRGLIALGQHSPLLPLPCDIMVERDVAVTLSDGTIIYTDIYRPTGDNSVPAIVAWSPYGKSNALGFLTPKKVALSNLQKFEGPDPAYWVNQGYAVINPDARGAGHSTGLIQQFGVQEGRDGADLVEWVAARDWSNGKVGLVGNSWLAISQWFIAAEQPKHLAAIAPWEGFADCYRYSICPGGIPTPQFTQEALKFLVGNEGIENLPAMLEQEPLMSALWRSKAADLTKVNVPAYVVASYTNKVHTRGTLHAWREIASAEKWLRVHNDQEWADFYAHQADLLKFFDHYLKGLENGWTNTPKVRLSVLDPGGTDIVHRAEENFPIPRTRLIPLYLNANDGGMSLEPPTDDATKKYDTACKIGQAGEGCAVFTHRFEQDTEIGGHLMLRLWVEAQGKNDLDLFTQCQKLDAQGNELPIMIHGSPYSGRKGAPYEWGNGWLRVSHRQVDPERSIEGIPVLTHENQEFVSEGQVVAVEIEIPPMAMRWRAGEQLRLIVAGQNMQKGEFRSIPTEVDTINKGIHVIHTGGDRASYLLLPVI